MDKSLYKTVKDLPIYSSANNGNEVWVQIEKEKSDLEKGVTSFRKSVCSLMQSFKSQTENSIQLYEKNKKVLNNNLEYIRSETNLVPKVVFISLSGLSGLLIGFRRSAFRKLIYSSVLTTASASLCFPNEAKVYYKEIADYGKKQSNWIYREYIWPDTNKNKQKVAAPPSSTNSSKQENSKDKVFQLDNQAIKATKSIEMAGDK